MNYYFEDFTEDNYRKILQLAKQNWSFIGFSEYRRAGIACLWRHDIDMSVHRAHRLAKIEKQEEVKATYFIHLHSRFYHFYEKEIVDLLVKIRDLGHDLALHFDPSFYGLKLGQQKEFEYWLTWEKEILERTFGIEVKAFSFHDPEVGGWHQFNCERIGGMLNTYAPYFHNNFVYCSDSNGYWRHQRLSEFLGETSNKKIQVLTHPEWWTHEPMSPRERMARCIEGRSFNTQRIYDESLAMQNRCNITFQEKNKIKCPD